MDIRKIKKLIELIEESGIAEIEIHEAEESVRITRINHQTITQTIAAPAVPATTPTPVATETTQPVAQQPEAEPNIACAMPGQTIKAPIVGSVYTAPTPGAKAFVDIGQQINVGDTLCIIEAMKMFNEVQTDIAGIVKARLVENGQPVEFDQPLFIIE